ncbi:MAG: hypothetical protein ACRD4B_01315, partial [Acidobacteriota bacterium]
LGAIVVSSDHVRAKYYRRPLPDVPLTKEGSEPTMQEAGPIDSGKVKVDLTGLQTISEWKAPDDTMLWAQFVPSRERNLIGAFFVDNLFEPKTLRYSIQCATCGRELSDQTINSAPGEATYGVSFECARCNYFLFPALLPSNQKGTFLFAFVLHANIPGSPVPEQITDFKLKGSEKRAAAAAWPPQPTGENPVWEELKDQHPAIQETAEDVTADTGDVSMVIFLPGPGQPDDPDNYVQRVADLRFPGARIHQWRIVGVRQPISCKDARILNLEMIAEGKLPYLGEKIGEYEGKLDQRVISVLYFAQAQATPGATKSAETQNAAGKKNIQRRPEDLIAMCFGFVNMNPSEEETFQLAFDLMERWNPRLYEEFTGVRTQAKVRAFTAPSLEKLLQILQDVAARDYSDFSAVFQTGDFEMLTKSTGLLSRAEVILATFWRAGSGEPNLIIGNGMDLTILPAG